MDKTCSPLGFFLFFFFCVFHEQEDCFIILLLSYGAILGCVWESHVEDFLKSSNFVLDVHELKELQWLKG